jgi:hypothetical protein
MTRTGEGRLRAKARGTAEPLAQFDAASRQEAKTAVSSEAATAMAAFLGAASRFEAKELRLIVGALGSRCAPRTLDQDGLQPRCSLPDACRSSLAGALVKSRHEPCPR